MLIRKNIPPSPVYTRRIEFPQYKIELLQLAHEPSFDPHKAMKRKSEIEARYLFLQRVKKEPSRLDTMLEFYGDWVEKMGTPQGLAECVLAEER
jgi:hypothetical protein